MKTAIITPAIVNPDLLYGAERHYVGMVQAFRKQVDTEWIQVPISEYNWESVLQGYLDCYHLDLSRFDVVVSTKNPTYMAQHEHHVCWLLHQMRVFYDRFDDEYGRLPAKALSRVRQHREVIHRLDTLGLREVRHIFTNGHETARRLKFYNGFNADVLHPPVFASGHYCGSQDYFLLPGRLHRWKRVGLALRAMQHIKTDIPLLIAGTGEDEPELRRLASRDSRIRFLGFVGDGELLDLYANALGVLFVPKEEDFGYITIEAMLSYKPVIVCKDSGEPAAIVKHGESGFVVEPDPTELARAMDMLIADRQRAREMGRQGFQNAPPQSWDKIVDRLLKAAAEPQTQPKPEAATPPLEENRIPVLVADNQVLDPPVGGGRIRIYELYRHLARLGFDISYVGAYDWPGPVYRDQMLAPHFRECVTPLTQPHFAHNRKYEQATGGKTTIDVTIPKLLEWSPRFRRMAEEFGRDAGAIIISHPWVYPHVPRHDHQRLIYDSHNCEFVVKQQILGDTAPGKELVEEVRKVEGDLCRAADLVFVCSQDDGDHFIKLYGISKDKLVLVPNGVDVEAIRPATTAEKIAARQEFGLSNDQPVLIFIGSGYGPNTEAARFLVTEVAPALPDCVFAIAGSVKDSYEAAHGTSKPANVKFLGTISAEQRLQFYHAADIALNPMFSGSGTNLKMLDYFAAGLPVISTSAGARGLELTPDECAVCPHEQFVNEISNLLADPVKRDFTGNNARRLADDRYSWSMIAAHAADAIQRLLQHPVSTSTKELAASR